MRDKVTSNEKLCLLGYEFWCSIAGEEIKRYKQLQEGTVKPVLKSYLSQYYQQLIELILVYINKEDDDMESWSVSKACSYIMHILVQLINSDIMKKIGEYIENNLTEDSLEKRNSAILLLTASIGNSHKFLLYDIFSKYMHLFLKLIFSENYTIKKNVSLLMIKVTKHHGKMFDNNTITLLITTMIGCLAFDNQIAINYCQCLINIIKTIGDSETKRNTSMLSKFFEDIFKELIAQGMKDNAYDREHNLCLQSFLTIETLISYSSHDKQAKLNEIVIYYLTFFEQSVINPASEVVYEIQSYYCIIFRSVLKKLVTPINKELAERIYKVIEASFKQRQTVYDEALFTIGALAESI
jgi:hypothetical protein